MDPALERLVLNPSCVSSGAINSNTACSPDNAAFKRLMNQFGMALAPTAMHAARTTGYGGFQLSLEGSFTSLDHDADYFTKGTRGTIDPSQNKASIRNNGPDSYAQVYMAKVRKGFPFGLELTGVVGYMSHTSLMVIGSDVRMALLEGFRTGAMGILPDLAVGGGVRTTTGSPQIQLTIASLDAQISKPITIADSSIFTPYIGWQMAWIFADSGLIDATPATNALQYCGYKGTNAPGSAGGTTGGGTTGYDGQPVCSAGAYRNADFNNTMVFDKVRLKRQRMIFGGNFRWEILTLGFQYATDLVDASAANGNDQDLKGIPKQHTLSVEVGAIF
jgi:hypothetical protein